MENTSKEKLSKEDINLLIIGIRLQLDKFDALSKDYDTELSEFAKSKKDRLVKLWEKLERQF